MQSLIAQMRPYYEQYNRAMLNILSKLNTTKDMSELNKAVADSSLTPSEARPDPSIITCVATFKEEYWHADIQRYVASVESVDQLFISESAVVTFTLRDVWQAHDALRCKYFNRVVITRDLV